MKLRILAVLSASLFVWFGGAIHSERGPVFRAGRVAEAAVKDASTPVQNTALGEIGRPNPGEPPASAVSILNKQLSVPSGIRMIVFSPHPDDESLAVSGLIQRVRSTGGKVNVVFMTNGDGYQEAVRRRLMRTQTTSSDFIEYGKMRHDEAVQAACQLGLQPEDVVFLGFPDDGIDDLWIDYWSRFKPYMSPFTRYESPPYKECFSQLVKYAGVDLSNEIARVIKGFSPDWVVMPDLRDEHPDHNTTGVFVLDALRKLNQEGEISLENVRLLTYLVHYMGLPRRQKVDQEGQQGGIGRNALHRIDSSYHRMVQSAPYPR